MAEDKLVNRESELGILKGQLRSVQEQNRILENQIKDSIAKNDTLEVKVEMFREG